MSFRVEWIQRAVNELAHIWTDANSELRQRITAAANKLDRELGRNPYRISEARSDDTEVRVLFVRPLGALIEIDLSKRTVKVAHVWRFRRHNE